MFQSSHIFVLVGKGSHSLFVGRKENAFSGYLAQAVGGAGSASCARFVSYLTQSVFKVVLQKSIPTQMRQLTLYTGNSGGYVDGFVGKLNSAKRLQKHLV